MGNIKLRTACDRALRDGELLIVCDSESEGRLIDALIETHASVATAEPHQTAAAAEEALTTARRPTSCSAAHFEEARKPRSDDSRMTLRSSSRARGSDNEMGAAERLHC